MVMYTGLRASVVVRPEFREAIAFLHDSNVNRPEEHKYEPGYSWKQVAEHYPRLPGVQTWAAFDRRDFIPFGSILSMPRDFSEKGKQYSDFSPSTGQWTFCCSLKNYGDEIETFIDAVLRHIVEKVDYCHSLYEGLDYDDDWTEHVTEHLKGT